jgi:membrane-associated protease RseP (regulator of RpoE activity)
MKANVGGIDKILRIVAGLALIAWAVMGGPVWAWIGVVPLLTGLVNFCPFYPLLGMSTCPVKKSA